MENDLSRNALPYATALAGACPRLAPAANVLPPEHRRFSSRAVFIPTLVLAALVLLVAGAVMVYSKLAERQYLRRIDAEIAQLEPVARRAAALDRNIANVRERAQLLDRLRNQTYLTPSQSGVYFWQFEETLLPQSTTELPFIQYNVTLTESPPGITI